MARSLILVALAAAVAGGEVKVRDLRLQIGTTPETDHPEQTYTDIDGTSHHVRNQTLDIGARGGIAMYESFGTLGRHGGAVLGLSFAHSEQSAEAETEVLAHPNVSPGYRLYGPMREVVNVFDLHLGWAYALSRHLHVEVMPFAGIGGARFQDHGGNILNGAHPRTYWEVGGRVGAFWTFGSGFQVGVDAGWIRSYAKSDMLVDNGKSEGLLIVTELDQSGPVAQASIGYRF